MSCFAMEALPNTDSRVTVIAFTAAFRDSDRAQKVDITCFLCQDPIKKKSNFQREQYDDEKELKWLGKHDAGEEVRRREEDKEEASASIEEAHEAEEKWESDALAWIEVRNLLALNRLDEMSCLWQGIRDVRAAAGGREGSVQHQNKANDTPNQPNPTHIPLCHRR